MAGFTRRFDALADRITVVVLTGPRILRPDEIEELDSKAPLGTGMFATVRTAWLRTIGGGMQQVAIKRNVNRSPKPDLELKELSAFAVPAPHENIIRFLGVIPHETCLEYVMAVADGGSLQKLLESKEMATALRSSPKRILHLLRGIASALAHLHRHNFVHRDLAARNVLLSSSDPDAEVAKLADWGTRL